jgi:hypothetical protein
MCRSRRQSHLCTRKLSKFQPVAIRPALWISSTILLGARGFRDGKAAVLSRAVAKTSQFSQIGGGELRALIRGVTPA